MKKKAAIGQVFIYIMALLIGGLILFYGSQMILDLLRTTGTVETGRLLKNIEARVNEQYNYGEGSEGFITVDLGTGNAEYLCIFDTDSEIIDCKYKDGDEIKKCELGMMGEDFSLLYSEGSTDTLVIAPLGTSDIGSYDIRRLKPYEGNPICYKHGERIKLITRRTDVAAA